MLTERGRVIALDGDRLWVQTVRESACSGCTLRQGCGQRLLNRLSGGRSGYLPVMSGPLAAAECRVGDQVEFGLAESALLRAGLAVYMLPLCLMLLGMVVETTVFPRPDPGAGLAGAVAGLLCGIAAMRLHAALTRRSTRFQPLLLRRLPGVAATTESTFHNEVIDA